MTTWVVKLGGSLANSEELPRWLDVIATAGAGKVVLVPGGGPWADEVRQVQKREGFDDRIAHGRALRAMEQYGKVLARMRANLVPAASIAEIHNTLRKGQVAVWMPHEMVVAEVAIPESWDVTSDSLAAWLAKRLDASGLLLVKAFTIDGLQPGVEDLMRRGWVDPAFAKFTTGRHSGIVLLGKGDQQTMQRVLTMATPATATVEQKMREL
jgi:aspartokinase-like uncharacterized kinase